MRKKLLKARKEAGFKTHDEIAERLGISRAHYTHIELGTRGPSLELAIKIARLLGKVVDDIFLPGDVSLCDDIHEEPPAADFVAK